MTAKNIQQENTQALELEQLYKAKKWQDYINLSQKIKEDLSEFNEVQIRNFYWWLGHAYKELKKYQEAEEYFNALNEKFPNQHYGYEGLVNVAQHQQNLEKILERAKAFQEKFPNMWQGYWWIGNYYKALKEYSKAEEQFNLLTITLPNTHQGIQGLIETANHEQHWEKAIKHSLELQEKKPDMWQGYWWAGQAYKNLNQYEQAEEQFNALKAKLPNQHYGHEGLVNVAQHKQDRYLTIGRATTFKDKFPNMWQGYWWIGQAYKDLCKYDKSEEQFDYLKNNFSNTHYGYQGMIDIANHQNNWQDALTFSEDYIKAFPKKVDGYYHKGMALRNLKRFDESEYFFIELSTQFPTEPHAFVGLANTYNTLRKWDKGIAVLEQALPLFPNSIWLANVLVDNYIMYNEPDKALQVFKERFASSHNINHKLLLAKIYQLKQGNAYYMDTLEELYREYPNDISVAIAYANALITYTIDEM